MSGSADRRNDAVDEVPVALAPRGGGESWLRFGIAIAALYYVWNSLYYVPYVVDDTFISLRYALNLASGEGLVYNPGHPVEGFSNFLWVVVESLIFRLGLPPLSSVKFVATASGLVSILLSYLLARRLFAGEPLAGSKCLLGVGLLAFNTSFAVWSQAGLETVFLSMWLVAMCLRFEIELDRRGAFPWSAVLFGLAWMTRPEVPIYGLYFVGRRWMARHDRSWGTPDLRWLAMSAVLIVPYEIWGLWYFGQLLPTTHVAKVGESGLDSVMSSRFLRQPALAKFLTRQGWGFPAMIALAAVGAWLGRRRLPPTLWLLPACGLVFVIYARGDWMPRHRYFVPILPVFFLLLGHGVVELLRAARQHRRGALVCGLVCGLTVVDYARVQMFEGEPGGWESRANRESKLPKQERGWSWFLDVPGQLAQREYPLENSALFVLANVPAGEPICLRDIGFPGFMGMNPIFDTAGLVTPIAARARRDRSPEMQAEMFEELLKIRPALFRLVLPPEREKHINWRIYDWLETDPKAKAQWKRVRPRGEVKETTTLVVYRRRDLPEVDYAARLSDAVGRLPEYADRAHEKTGEEP